jgi:diguanylate cyclase (GGDEF)-like protein
VYAPRTTTAAAAPNQLDATSFAATLDEEFELAVRHDWPLSLLLVEIDDFGDMNERQKPESGAQIHEDVTALLRRNIRPGDTIAAQGVDRFSILLPGSEADQAAVVAKRLVDAARRNVSHGEPAGSFSVTVSLGVATLNQDTPFSRTRELFAAATAALEHSTNTGRDRHTAYARIRAA